MLTQSSIYKEYLDLMDTDGHIYVTIVDARKGPLMEINSILFYSILLYHKQVRMHVEDIYSCYFTISNKPHNQKVVHFGLPGKTIYDLSSSVLFSFFW